MPNYFCQDSDKKLGKPWKIAEAAVFVLYFIISVSYLRILVVVSFRPMLQCLQCFDTVGWVAGRASSL